MVAIICPDVYHAIPKRLVSEHLKLDLREPKAVPKMQESSPYGYAVWFVIKAHEKDFPHPLKQPVNKVLSYLHLGYV